MKLNLFLAGLVACLALAVAFAGDNDLFENDYESSREEDQPSTFEEAEARKQIHQAYGCADRNLCCQKKNNTCWVRGPSMRQKEAKKCFCDAECMTTGDCCMDYSETCSAEDCQLSGWGGWGDCSKQCGWGVMERSRKIQKYAVGHGKYCSDFATTQKRYCFGENCRGPRGAFGAELRETAKVLPAEYGTYRRSKTYNPYKDIRKNLFNHYSANSVVERPQYCAEFEITENRKSCRFFDGWASQVKRGTTVCVECQQFAMKRKLGVRCKGHGVFMKETRWNAITIPGCHGKWVMKTRHEECSCRPSKEISVILI